jgi:hypothetical protein
VVAEDLTEAPEKEEALFAPCSRGRCDADVADTPDLCWWCGDSLCPSCWEAFGDCGHPEADKANEDPRRALTWAERHAIANRRPIAGPRAPRRLH